jgi:hypothetical protein
MKHPLFIWGMLVFLLAIALHAAFPPWAPPEPLEIETSPVESWSWPVLPLCPHELYQGEVVWMHTCPSEE